MPRTPTGPAYEDDGVPLGRYSWGHNVDDTRGPAVIIKANSNPGVHIKYRYDVILPVTDEWQAKAIAAILNAEI